ncbi:MAG: cytochrome c biogenesis protein CcsA [Candidatus Acidiferrales bacterium]
MHSGLLEAALAFYGLGTLLTIPSIIRRRPSVGVGSLTALSAGLFLNGAALVFAAVQLRRLPVVDVRSALSFFAFNVTLAFFLLYRRYHITWLGVLIFPFVFLLTLAAVLNPARPFVSSTLRGGWLLVHGSAMILGYTGLFLTFVAAILYLLQEGVLKSKQPRAFYDRLPSLEVCNRLYDRSLAFGLVCLSVGIITGALWASRAWGGNWELDPKILATLLTWFLYIALFSTRFSGSWRGRRSAYVAIFGFAATMVTFLGISFLSLQHGYFPIVSRIR